MSPLALVWLQFIGCVCLIGLSGFKLIRYGDALATLTGMSRSWVGLILVATVTSLPELVTGLSSVTVANAPDLAIGDALGSCIFNLAILAWVDVFYRKRSVYSFANHSHILSAGFGVILLAATALVFALTAQGLMPSLGHVSWGSLLIVCLYAFGIRTLYLFEQNHQQPQAVRTSDLALKPALTGYAWSSMVIVGCGIWLPLIGVELARLMGWSDSFVGTLLVALATSVPEVATTVGAVRIGAIDLAVANLLGSNLFDTLILSIDDFAYVQGILFARASTIHVVSALTACLMTGLVVVALAYRPASRVMRIGSWASIALLALYVLNAVLQYAHGRQS